MSNFIKILFLAALIGGCTPKAPIGTEASAAPEKEFRVFICFDMEGVSGIVHLTDCNEGGMDYQYFRKIATNEVNAAVRGAFMAGATQVVVRDAHETMRNLIPDQIDPRVHLIRGGDGANPEIMMQGADGGFDALVFIGHHSGAGTPRGILAHTMVVDGIQEFSVNGKQIPEMAYCAMIGTKYGMPAAYLSGDDVACAQAKAIFGENFATTVTKKAMGWKVGECFPIADVQKQIELDVCKALSNRENFCLYQIAPPYKCYLRVKEGKDAKGKPVIKEYNWESADMESMMAYFWERI